MREQVPCGTTMLHSHCVTCAHSPTFTTPAPALIRPTPPTPIPRLPRSFIRKVYAILSAQLFVTFGLVALFVWSDGVKHFVQTTPAFIGVACAIQIVSLISLACCGDLRRKYPTNYIFLAAFTIAEGVLVGTISSFYDADVVAAAVCMCAGVTVAVSLYAARTKQDFTTMGASLFAGLIILIIFGIFAALMRDRILSLVYSTIGALIFCAYLAYDTQMLLGGRSRQIGPDDYVFAALEIYIDIIQIFLHILRILGSSRR
jgi:FtsH-binding integral membrane protein